jgi:CRISPR-associated protein Csd1
MILLALKEYYDRKTEEQDSGIAPEGWEFKEIPFVIVLNPDGTLANLENTSEGSGGKRNAKPFLVPKTVIRSSGIKANLFWDNPDKALGFVKRGNQERAKKQHALFKANIKKFSNLNSPGINALIKFLDQENKITILERNFPETWQELIDFQAAKVTFRLVSDDQIIVRREEIVNAIEKARSHSEGERGFCLVTGEENQPLETLHPLIKGIRGALSTGANLVSFNWNSFKSFGKEQGANAPVSKFAAFAYSEALNYLLRKDSRQRIQIGDSTTVFWADRQTDFENQVINFFSEPPKDDPDRSIEAVRALYESVKKGSYWDSDKETRFYVLGLAPNAKRLAVRFWHVGTIPEMAARFYQYFEDVKIIHGNNEKAILSLLRLLNSLAAQGKSENIPPNLAGDIMRSILSGLPFPATLLQAAVRRNRAEQNVRYPRAALIKAFLNRSVRFNNPKNEKEISMSLDPTNTNIGYCLGRLFAALEKIQSDANPGINATIRDRFYGAASGSPVSVFGNLIRLTQHHLGKLPEGLRIARERLVQEIISEIGDFPPHLDVADQGRFAIGYYHQMQDFYTKKTNNE